jgi:hypothetical protein
MLSRDDFYYFAQDGLWRGPQPKLEWVKNEGEGNDVLHEKLRGWTDGRAHAVRRVRLCQGC